MSRSRSERILRETTDFLLDVGRLQPKFSQRVTNLNTELQRIEQEHQEALQHYSHQWEAASKEQEALRAKLAATQIALANAEAALMVARSEAEKNTQVLRQELENTLGNSQEVPQVTAQELAASQRQLEQLRRKINSPRFWSGAFAETFAESLASMDSVHQALEVESSAEVTEVFRSWQQEIVSGLELFDEAGFDADIAEHLRRLLICQWVYLRWQEVTS